MLKIRLLLPVLMAALWVSPGPAAMAGETASFIAGTYVMEGRCEKLAALAAGGPRNVETVPETLTAKGFDNWEGGCAFTSIQEKEKGRVWTAKLSCGQSADEWEETDTFELDPKDGSLKVTVDDATTRFVRCDEKKGN